MLSSKLVNDESLAIEDLEALSDRQQRSVISSSDLDDSIEQIEQVMAEQDSNNYLRRLYGQSKAISQMVCFVWRYADEDANVNDDTQDPYRYKGWVARELALYLEYPFEVPSSTKDQNKKQKNKFFIDCRKTLAEKVIG